MIADFKLQIHAHWCEECEGYSPCVGIFQPVCLLTDSCVQCGRVLQGVPPVHVIDEGWPLPLIQD